MIKLNVNNKRSIEITQEIEDGNINVDTIDSNGEVESFITISAGDMTILLNYYQYKKGRGEELL